MDTEQIREMFAGFRPVDVRSMFGGAALMAGGITFAIVFDGVIYLKTNEASLADFEREGSKPFVYPLMKKPPRRKKPSTFWRMPERLYDDPDDLAKWAERSLAIAQKKKASGGRPTPKLVRAKKKAARKSVAKPRARKRMVGKKSGKTRSRK